MNSSIECCRNYIFLKAHSQGSITLVPFVVGFWIIARLKTNYTVVALSYSIHTWPWLDQSASHKVRIGGFCDWNPACKVGLVSGWASVDPFSHLLATASLTTGPISFLMWGIYWCIWSHRTVRKKSPKIVLTAELILDLLAFRRGNRMLKYANLFLGFRTHSGSSLWDIFAWGCHYIKTTNVSTWCWLSRNSQGINTCTWVQPLGSINICRKCNDICQSEPKIPDQQTNIAKPPHYVATKDDITPITQLKLFYKYTVRTM